MKNIVRTALAAALFATRFLSPQMPIFPSER
jgi:hypothetical protein